ncbi:MAG: GntR family transcriptional regulator, partial [Anaerolineales bacterium]
SDDVVVRLRDAISSGQLAPGERLSEELLAEMVGISRGPIREALTQLEREGLVIKQRNKGTFVARLSREDLDEVYSLRLALEKLAMQQVILTADSKHLVEMQAIVDEMAADVSANPTPQTEAELDLRFHDILYQASKHRRLCDCWATIRPQIYIFLLTRNVADPDFRQVTVQGHQDIVDAIRAKDEERAITVIASHLQSAYERIVKSYSQSGGSGADHFPPIDQSF